MCTFYAYEIFRNVKNVGSILGTSAPISCIALRVQGEPDELTEDEEHKKRSLLQSLLMSFGPRTRTNWWQNYFRRTTTRSTKSFLRMPRTFFLGDKALSKLMIFSWSQTQYSASRDTLRKFRTHILQMWTCTSWSKWRSRETSAQECPLLFRHTHTKKITRDSPEGKQFVSSEASNSITRRVIIAYV